MSKTFKNQLHVCVCCLSRESPLINLNNCKHVILFSNLFQNRLNFKGMCVCWLCHSTIKKIHRFKCQVEDSYSNLNRISDKLLVRNNSFIISKIEINSIVDSHLIEFEVKNIIEDQSETQELTTTLKVEHDSDSELDSALPLALLDRRKKEIKKDQLETQKLTTTVKVKQDSDVKLSSALPLMGLKRRKVENKKDNNNKKGSKIEGTKEKYDGKIKVVMLTWDQMMEERSVEASKKSYQHLPFKCESCITSYDHEITLKVHMEQKHMKREGGLECNICKSVLSTERAHKEHMTRHMKRYECMACGKRNNSIHPVIKHYNEQHGNITTNFTCAECGFTTESNSRYRYHLHSHKAKVECKECGSIFAHPSGLRAHMLTVHGHSDRMYACETCNKRFKYKSSLVSHQSRHAVASPLTYCTLCSNHYSTPLGLKHHLKTHSKHVKENDKRFICDECGSKFTTKWSLEQHIDWVHLKKIKHECDKCSKVDNAFATLRMLCVSMGDGIAYHQGFKNNAALKKHINYVHEKKRPPRNKMCDHCGRGFTTMQILRSHVRTHTGERPLKCSHCEATFAHPAALYTHTKLVHGKN